MMKTNSFCTEKYDKIVSALIMVAFVLSICKSYIYIYDAVCLILGIVGIIYSVYTFCIIFFNKIKFDRILVKKNFIHKVINIVLLIPFIIVFLFLSTALFTVEYSDYETLRKSLAKELVFSDVLYAKDIKEISVSGKNSFDDLQLISELYDWTIITDTNNHCLILKEIDVLPKDIVDTEEEEPSLFWSVYYHYIDSGNQHIASTEKGRKWATVTSIMGYFFLNGLLIAVLIGWFDRRRNEWIKGEVRYSRFLKRKKHHVVIGGNGMTPGLLQQLLKKDDYIIIQTSRDVETFRRELYSELEESQKEHVVIYYGNRTSKSDIEDLMLETAIDIYVLGESLADDGQNHDAYNMDCLRLITDTLPYDIEKKNVYVIFENQITFSAFQFSDISVNDKKKINYIPLNYYEMWAQKIFAYSDPTNILNNKNDNDIEYYPLDMIRNDVYVSFISENDKHHVHLVVIGMSKMGVTMGLEAAYTGHYPNALTSKGARTRITFIDEDADRESGYLMNRYSDMFALARWRYVEAERYDCRKGVIKPLYSDFDNDDATWHDPLHSADSTSPYKDVKLGVDGEERGNEFFIDIEWEFIKGGLNNFSVQQYLRECANKESHPDKILTIAVCLEETHQSIAGGLYLPDVVYENALQILVYQRYSDSILKYIADSVLGDDIGKNEKYKNIKPFGMMSETFSLMLVDDYLAKLVNFVYCHMEHIYDDKTGEYKWDILEKATDEQIDKAWNNSILRFNKGKSGCASRWSNIYNANTIRIKLRDINWDSTKTLDDDTISTMAMTEHNRWNVEQLLMHYSPVRKEEQKELIRLNTSDKQEHKKRKDALKQQMRHVDICSYNRLKDVDGDTIIYDIVLSAALPYFVKKYNDR